MSGSEAEGEREDGVHRPRALRAQRSPPTAGTAEAHLAGRNPGQATGVIHRKAGAVWCAVCAAPCGRKPAENSLCHSPPAGPRNASVRAAEPGSAGASPPPHAGDPLWGSRTLRTVAEREPEYGPSSWSKTQGEHRDGVL